MADARTLVKQFGPVGPEGLQYFTETKKGYYIAYSIIITASAVYEAVRANGYSLVKFQSFVVLINGWLSRMPNEKKIVMEMNMTMYVSKKPAMLLIK